MMTRKTLLTLGTAVAVIAVAMAASAHDHGHGWGGQHKMRGEHAQGMQNDRGPGMMRGRGHGGMGMADSPVFGAFDTDGDGRVSPAEAEAGLAGLLAAHDADGDGSLSRAEFDALFVDVTRHRAARPFAMLDADENGLIDAEELRFPAQMMARMQKRHAADAPAVE